MFAIIRRTTAEVFNCSSSSISYPQLILNHSAIHLCLVHCCLCCVDRGSSYTEAAAAAEEKLLPAIDHELLNGRRTQPLAKSLCCSSIVNIPPTPPTPEIQGAIVEARRAAAAAAFNVAVRMKRKIMKLRGGTSWIRDLFIAPMVCVACF